MSWWVYLCEHPGDPGSAVTVPEFQEGGTQVLGGSTVAELNVTYNYGKYFRFKEELHGKQAKDVVLTLSRTILRLGTKRDNDYWKSTEGNVGYTCSILLDWASKYPDAWFEVH